ncbi:hypothetical protein JZO70_16090 [Enterococcus sp. 669A]|uniref:Uncharacterized protein n=1 Tax=Candidatus Enterococcus moelleringii TaxID=2815325 RepID=A0ABS3LF99_9ENTE|nr:hypothetical protein [Enterococcus sp. 669A]MBO1307698.1 hypothetical protein [Enterococcus sp. 669A]
MPNIEIHLTDAEKKILDDLGMTNGDEIKPFIFRKIAEETIPPILSNPKKSKRVSLKADGDGSLILPDNVPEHVKEWVRRG